MTDNQTQESTITDKFACVVIAAGNSSRLGEPKQLLKFGNTTLLNRTLRLAQAMSNQVVCVLGANSEVMRQSIDINITHSQSVQLVKNKDWQVGMGSSIAKGVSALASQTEAVMILLCDQWQITTDDLHQLKQLSTENPNKLIASEYKDTQKNKIVIGAPAIFPANYFNSLKQLSSVGAQSLLKAEEKHLIKMKNQRASFDIDTPEDLAKYRNTEIPK